MDVNLTDTTSRLSFPVHRPNNSHVIFEFEPLVESSNQFPPGAGVTRITIPEGSTWTPEPHWHESYIEYFRVVKGRILLIRDGEPKVLTPADGPQIVPKFVVHDFMRADRDATAESQKDKGDAVVEEWTDPADGIKQVFFRNLLGVVADAARVWRGRTTLQILLISRVYDNYPVVLPSKTPKVLSWLATHLLFRCVQLAAIVSGLSPWHAAYTPQQLQAIAVRGCPAKGLPEKDE